MFTKSFILINVFCIVSTNHLTKEIVRNWASTIEEYLIELAKEGLRTKELQMLYDESTYVEEQRSGLATVEAVKEKLGDYFSKKEQAAKVSDHLHK